MAADSPIWFIVIGVLMIALSKPATMLHMKMLKAINNLRFGKDHKNKKITATFKQKTKKMPKNVDTPAPAKKKPAKSKEQKDKDMREKVIKFIIANKDVLDDERLK